MKKGILIIAAASLCWLSGSARNNDTGNRGVSPTNPSILAGCTRATTATDLDINNIKVLVQTGGDMWWDFTNPRFEVPKGSDRHAMFAGALWMGGQDVSGQLKVAAQRYRSNGDDFWPGPLSTQNFEIEPATCAAYDRHFVTTRIEIEKFKKWYDAGLADAENGTSTQQDDFPEYSIPSIIYEWPAHGRDYDPYNEDFYLAPFVDRDGDGFYNPGNGDYPGYVLDLGDECNKGDRKTDVYGDMNLWWVFNDKGNVHTESGSNSIGMEIRAQAFSFATNDEVNNMTFCNYELINRSSFTLTETYFGVFADADLGGANDDFVGCDVQKGLGYCYNGDDNDADDGGAKGYGSNPPAIGIDFFEGPYQDSDGIDNAEGIGEGEALNGVGYGDSEVDNERFGMRRFVYFNRTGASCCTDPESGPEYYNFLRSVWKDGSKMTHGGNGHGGTLEADFMFPGTSDPLNWGTRGTDPSYVDSRGWTEEAESNTAGDRRFIQSAGPFTLTPGAVNDITVGIVWARASSGSAFASVEALLKADEKTQALFDNCFKLLGGPDAPDLQVQELDKELILYITNNRSSNNYGDGYKEKNAFIIAPDSIEDGNGGYTLLTQEEKNDYISYKFQGYKVYQLRNGAVDPSALGDIDQARLVYQGDVRDGVSNVVNYTFDQDLQVTIPAIMVEGADNGINHSIRVTEDLFASGDRRLVNHKTYYFMAVAYAYNNFKQFDPADPAADGQTTQYLESRKSTTGAIKPVSGIPHITLAEGTGTVVNSSYGDGVELTRLEGAGNGGNALEFSNTTDQSGLFASPWRIKNPTYAVGNGPVDVKVVDPLNVIEGEFAIQLMDSTDTDGLFDAYWKMYRTDVVGDTVFAARTIDLEFEQLILDWGLSVTMEQSEEPGESAVNPMLAEAITFEDQTKPWLSGIGDIDGDSLFNWVYSGTGAVDWIKSGTVGEFIDPTSFSEGILDGTFAPFRLASYGQYGPMQKFSNSAVITGNCLDLGVENLASVDIVFTSDKSKWSRSPVVEAYFDTGNTIGGAKKGRLRKSASVDKDGNPYAGGDGVASSNENDPNYIAAEGMGWFPGYAVNIETGERLNIAFSENSWLKQQNGSDMIWNPTDVITEGPFDDIRNGGMHFIYVFRNNDIKDNNSYNVSSNGNIQQTIPWDDEYNEPSKRMPAYDEGRFIQKWLNIDNGIGLFDTSLKHVYSSCMWIGYPLLRSGRTLLETDATVSLRVRKGYTKYAPEEALNVDQSLVIGTQYFVNAGPLLHDGDTLYRGDSFVARTTGISAITTDYAWELESESVVSEVVNGGLPLYSFSTEGLAPVLSTDSAKEAILGLINIVPNPYYAYSQYETDRLDNRVKIVNLPEKCTITVYSINGSLIRQYRKDDPTVTSVDWDLKNFANIPIASGVYLVHVDAPEIGEKVLKWFGSMRPVDLDSF